MQDIPLFESRYSRKRARTASPSVLFWLMLSLHISHTTSDTFESVLDYNLCVLNVLNDVTQGASVKSHAHAFASNIFGLAVANAVANADVEEYRKGYIDN